MCHVNQNVKTLTQQIQTLAIPRLTQIRERGKQSSESHGLHTKFNLDLNISKSQFLSLLHYPSLSLSIPQSSPSSEVSRRALEGLGARRAGWRRRRWSSWWRSEAMKETRRDLASYIGSRLRHSPKHS
ncbi:hypothetical protein ACB092_11G047600 [Castanea dentata]